MTRTPRPAPFPVPGKPEVPAGETDRKLLRYLVRGRGIKADLRLEDWRGRLVVVKDYRGRNWFGRWIGRFQIRREERIYRILADTPGVPPFFGILTPESLAVGHLEGRPIDQFQGSPLVDRILAELRALLDRVHRRGVVHVDLRRRNNLLVNGQGIVHLIDFAGSVHLRPAGRAGRWLLPVLKQLDEFAFLKWKQRLAPATLSDREKVRLRRITVLRAFWFFN